MTRESVSRDSGEHEPMSASPLLEISNVMVRLYKDAFGRGPTKARTRFSGQDTLVVLLEDTMTVAERRLVGLGEYARVREQRLFLQLAFEDLKRTEVERILARRTVALVCGIDPHRDVAAEVFTLEPSHDLTAQIETAAARRDGELGILAAS